MVAVLNSASGQTNLGPAGVTIGRSADNSLVVNDPQVSSRHAEIRPSGQNYVITDLGSGNGTYLNSQPLTPRVPYALNSGDVVRVGNATFTYVADPAADADRRASAAPGQWGNPGYAPPGQGSPPGFSNTNQPPQQAYPQAPANYQQQSYPQPAANYPQQAYSQPPGNYPQPGQQPYFPPGTEPGQFGQPGQPGYSTAPVPPVQPRKRGRTGLWIALVVIVLLILAGSVGAYLYVHNVNSSTPTKTLQAYCNALKSGDAQGAYNQLSSRAQKQTSVQGFKDAFKILGLVGGIKDCTVGSVQENGSTATGTITFTFGNGKTSTSSGPLVEENGVWKIDSTSNVPGR